MRVKKMDSEKEVLIKYRDYLIDWNKRGASKLETQFKSLIYPYWQNSIILEIGRAHV